MIRRLLAAILLGTFALNCSSKGPQTTPVTAKPQSSFVADPASSPITAAAQREVIRRQERMRRADEAALRAARQMSDGDYESALSSSRNALGGL